MLLRNEARSALHNLAFIKFYRSDTAVVVVDVVVVVVVVAVVVVVVVVVVDVVEKGKRIAAG